MELMDEVVAVVGRLGGEMEGRPEVVGELAQAARSLRARGVGRALLVMDPGLRANDSFFARVAGALEGLKFEVFSELSENPKVEQAAAGYGVFERVLPEAIVAVGGGSTIDTAKGILLHVMTDGDLEGADKGWEARRVPFVAAPTTAGTGSEATGFAAIYFDGVKRSLKHPGLLPDVAVLDAALTETLPDRIAAATGLDALCQAIESIWSVGADERSLGYALEGLELAWRHLRHAVCEGDAAARQGMLAAAHLAGRAIHISKTTACHALSYRITTVYGVPHGNAVALTIGPMLVHNMEVSDADCTDPRGAAHVRERIERVIAALGARSAAEAAERLRDLIEAVGSPTRLGQVGVRDEAAVAELAAAVNVERLANNPRRLNGVALRGVLMSVL